MTSPRTALQVFPIARLDLDEEVRLMRASPTSAQHLGKTVLHNRDLRVVLMTLEAGARIPDHHADGSLTIHVLDGHIVVTLLESSFDLGPDQMLAIDGGIPHTFGAVEDSSILLTLAWTP